MYAVIESGGQQHRVSEGDVLKLEKINADAGEEFEFEKVLMVSGDSVKIGTPILKDCKVVGEILAHGKYPKIRIVKFNRRKHYRNETGHRQWFTEVKITGINI